MSEKPGWRAFTDDAQRLAFWITFWGAVVAAVIVGSIYGYWSMYWAVPAELKYGQGAGLVTATVVMVYALLVTSHNYFHWPRHHPLHQKPLIVVKEVTLVKEVPVATPAQQATNAPILSAPDAASRYFEEFGLLGPREESQPPKVALSFDGGTEVTVTVHGSGKGKVTVKSRFAEPNDQFSTQRWLTFAEDWTLKREMTFELFSQREDGRHFFLREAHTSLETLSYKKLKPLVLEVRCQTDPPMEREVVKSTRVEWIPPTHDKTGRFDVREI